MKLKARDKARVPKSLILTFVSGSSDVIGGNPLSSPGFQMPLYWNPIKRKWSNKRDSDKHTRKLGHVHPGVAPTSVTTQNLSIFIMCSRRKELASLGRRLL